MCATMSLQVWVSLLLLSACTEAYNIPEDCPDAEIVHMCPGADGRPGVAGPAGQRGPAGEPGIRGLKGDPGSPGTAGAQGYPGAAGPKGDRGEVGPKGLKGDPGSPATAGAQGYPGATGPKGDRGEVGPKGDTPDVSSVFCQKGPRSCRDILYRGNRLSGWYSIYLVDCSLLQVFCDMDTDGGGWLVFQRRMDGSVEFYRNYESYKGGFGLQTTEFWLGNDNIHLLTRAGTMSLRVDLEDFNGKSTFAKYETFTVLGETDKYQLRMGPFLGGTAGDSLTAHSGKPFSTFDQDNDEMPNNCAVAVRGAWWYYTCYQSNLNGAYAKNGKETHSYGIDWASGNGIGKSYKRTEMKIR